MKYPFSHCCSTTQSNRRLCPACERPVARGAFRCPYCDESLPGALRDALARFALWLVPPVAAALIRAAWPNGPVAAAVAAAFLPAVALLAVRVFRRGAAWRPSLAWGIASIAVVAALALDPALRLDALRLWRAHGLGLALAAAAVSALCPAPATDAVSGATPRERLADALLRRAPDILGAALAATLSLSILPASAAGAVLLAAVGVKEASCQ